jgi:hypothetical protein
MRALSCILIALGIYLLAASAYDEFRGITRKPATLVGKARSNHAYLYRMPIRREQDPELFRQFMEIHWLYAAGFEGAGWFFWFRNRKPQ